MDDKILNVQPDAPDLRDRMYNPTLRQLWRAWNTTPYVDPLWTDRIKDQGTTEACTGFAIASMIEILTWRAWDFEGREGQVPVPVSPFMLFYFARRYDDIPGEMPANGSTARGAMKAWHKQGAARAAFWQSMEPDEPPQTNWFADAFERPLGAYYRVDHLSIPDIHAAINETGVVYVTAQIHTGWAKPVDGSILLSQGSQPSGGHAFLLIGYDSDGFWIQNSWGGAWGKAGFARLSYSDWEKNAMDAWTGQLGVRISEHASSLATGLDLSLLPAGPQASGTGADAILLSSNGNLSAQQINPYIINLGNDGVLADSGQFATREQDLHDLLDTYLPNAVKQFQIPEGAPIDIAIYAHGGLTDQNAAADTARVWIPAIFARKIFPIFIMWETGLWQTLGDVLADALHLSQQTAGGVMDVVTDWWDARLETFASKPGTLEWSEMKKNADAASSNPQGGLNLFHQILADPKYGQLRPRLRLHLIGHSAGSIFHGYLLPKLTGANLNVDGVYFMAPACRVELFEQNVLPQFKAGLLKRYAQFCLTDVVERQDTCDNIYRRSLLYLVSNAFEDIKGAQILGMEKFYPNIGAPVPGPGQEWDNVTSPSGQSVSVEDRTNSTSHGGFSSDPDTREAILTRIAARR